MKQIVYLSSAPRLFSPSEVMGIVRVSRANNEASGVTGALLYGNGSFIQVLEGEPETVDATLERIERDPRHRSVLRLLDTRVDTRFFPEWSMGLLHLHGLSAEDREMVSSLSTAVDSALPGRANRLLRSFRSQLVRHPG